MRYAPQMSFELDDAALEAYAEVDGVIEPLVQQCSCVPDGVDAAEMVHLLQGRSGGHASTYLGTPEMAMAGMINYNYHHLIPHFPTFHHFSTLPHLSYSQPPTTYKLWSLCFMLLIDYYASLIVCPTYVHHHPLNYNPQSLLHHFLQGTATILSASTCSLGMMSNRVGWASLAT